MHPPSLPIEALLFDLGNVLVEFDFERAFAQWAARSGVPLAEIRRRFRMDDFYERHERGEIGASEYFDSLRESLVLDLADEDLEEGWDSIFIREIPGVRALLRSLEGRVPLYVFSNTNLNHHRVWSAQFADMLRSFDRVFVSHELGKRKPTPEAFHAVSQAIDIPPEHILFFDDGVANVAGALAIGMQAVHVGSVGDIESAIRRCGLSTPGETPA